MQAAAESATSATATRLSLSVSWSTEPGEVFPFAKGGGTYVFSLDGVTLRAANCQGRLITTPEERPADLAEAIISRADSTAATSLAASCLDDRTAAHVEALGPLHLQASGRNRTFRAGSAGIVGKPSNH
jgi:hypothetical protein